MDTQPLEDIGLTNSQAKAYIALIEHYGGTAPSLAKATNESRSNTYKVLDKLCELGLATKDTKGAKIYYYPTNPAALELLIQGKNTQIELQARKLKAVLP